MEWLEEHGTLLLTNLELSNHCNLLDAGAPKPTLQQLPLWGTVKGYQADLLQQNVLPQKTDHLRSGG